MGDGIDEIFNDESIGLGSATLKEGGAADGVE